MTASATASRFLDRILGAARLDIDTYEEIEADRSANWQALAVILLTAVANGGGTALAGGAWWDALLNGVLYQLLGWTVWSFVTYLIGTRVFRGQATYGELLRTMGFAYTPGFLLLFQFLPSLGGMVRWGVLICYLATGYVAVRQALDLDDGRALATILIGAVALVGVSVLAFIGFGLLALAVRPA